MIFILGASIRICNFIVEFTICLDKIFKKSASKNIFKEESLYNFTCFSKMSFSEAVDEYNSPKPLFGFRAELEHILDFLNYRENPNLTDFFGTTLLHFAVIDNHDNFDIVEKLIKAGANVDAQNNCKQTPLHLAVLRHNWRVIDTLIAYDADINIKEQKGNTALHFAIDLLWSRRRRNHLEMRSRIVKKLLNCGADPNISNANGETPLMIAVKYGDLDIVRELLASGSNVHQSNKYSETCLHLLSWCPQPDVAILKLLLEHGACVNCCDDICRTALDVFLETDKFGHGKQLTESIIKITTLVNWKQKIVFQVTRRNREKMRSFEGFIEECYKEVSRMKSHIYSDEATLCHFAINGGKVTGKDNSRKAIFDEVLNTLIQDNFPIYGDFIEAHFDNTFLKEKLFDINIYTKNRKGTVRLNSYAVSYLASYLSSHDLLNLLRAYAKPFKFTKR